MTITPGIYNIRMIQGATFNPVFTWKDENNALVNLTGYTAKMQGRTTFKSRSTFFNLTTENGGITLGGAAGTIALLLTATQTAALNQNGVYDLKLYTPSATQEYRLFKGTVIIDPEVTT